MGFSTKKTGGEARRKAVSARRFGGRRVVASLTAVLLSFSGLGSLALHQSPPAQAEVLDNGFSQTFYVNDARDIADVTPGDGVCATRFSAGTPAAPTCTLYAAIQEANARPAGESILIAPAPQIRQVDGSYAASAEIDLNWNTTNNPTPQVTEMSLSMVADSGISGVIDGDRYSRYWIQHDNVTLDFQNRLGWKIAADSGYNVLLFTGKDQTFRNFTKLTSAESGIYVGATAENFSLLNGAIINPATTPALPSNYAIERSVVIVEGAKNTVIQNIAFERSYWDAVLLAPASNASLVIDGLTIDRSRWDQPVNGGGYDPVYNYFVRNWSSAVSGNNVLITNNSVRAWGADGGNSNVISFVSGTWNDVMIRGNTFTATVNQSVNPIIFNGVGATTAIVRDNTFVYAGPGNRGSTVDYSWVRSYGNTNGMQIFNNRFVGGNNTLQIANQATTPSATTVPTFRNTMTGVAGTVTAANENTLTTNNNIYNNSNGLVRTAFPTLAAVIDTPPQSCRIDLSIAPPGTGGTAIPTQAIYVDVYLGRTTATGGDNVGLEQYLGRISTTQAALPGVFSLPYTGAGVGNVVRLQTTEVATGRTSQYSRTVAATGTDTCAPQSWIKQGGWFNEAGDISSTQEDPTSFRNVQFEIQTSEPLGTDGLSTSDIVFSGTAPGQQVVSLTQVSGTTWSLVTKANGTGTIVPSVAAGTINDVSGNASVAESNTTDAPISFAGFSDASQTLGIAGPDVDHSVTYESPLRITQPDPLELDVAEPGTTTQTFRVSNLTANEAGQVEKAPSATVFLNQVWSDLVPDASLPNPVPPQTAAGIAKALATHPNLSTTEPTLDTIDLYVDVPVQAIDNLTVDGTRGATLNLEVTSEDPEFDGLLLSPVQVTVADNDEPVADASVLAVTQNGQLANGLALNALTANVKNADGALVSNAEVAFTVPTNTVWVGPDGIPSTPDDVVGGDGVVANIVTAASGIAELKLFSTQVGTYSVEASVDGGAQISDSPQNINFVRVPVDTVSPDTNYTVSSGNVVANGTSSHTVTVNLRDSSGSPATGWEESLTAVATPSAGVTVGAFTPTANPGEYSATVVSTTSGTKGITVSLVDDASVNQPIGLLGGGNADAVFVAGPPVLTDGKSSVSIDDSNDRLADGIAFHRVTVVLADANNNAVTGAASQLSSSVADNGNGAVVVTAFSETAVLGTYQALVRSTESGAQAVTVAYDGSLTIGTVDANFAAGAVDLGNAGSRFSVSTGSQPVGSGQHTITVTLADANGNPVSNQSVSLNSVITGSLGAGTVTGFVETATPGTYTATVTSTTSGGKTVAVRLGVAAVTLGGNGTALFAAGEVDLGNSSSSFTVSGGDVSVEGGEHGVTVRLADEFGNPVGGRAADLNATTGDNLGGGSIAEFEETGPTGTYTAKITSTVSGDKTIEATLDGDLITLDGNDVATFVAGGVDTDSIGTRYTVSSGDETVGTGSHTITVTLADANGNPVPNEAEGILSTTLDDLGTGDITAFTESSTPGTYTATITSSVSGGKTITTVFGAAKLTVLLDGNDTASFVPAAVDLENGASGYFVSPGSQPVGTGQHAVTIRLVDGLNNPVSGLESRLLVATADPLGAGEVSGVTETAVPGTYEAVVTSTVAGAKNFSVTFDSEMVNLTGNGTATFAAGGVDLSNPASTYSVSGGDASVSGGSHSVTVSLADSFGNPVAAQAAFLNATTPNNLGSGSIGAFISTGPGSYAATITSSVSGDKTIDVTLNGSDVTLSGNGVARFISGGVDPANENTRFSVSTGAQTVGSGSHTITVTLADTDGNPVPGQAAGLAGSSIAGLGGGSVSSFTESDTTPGTYTATVTSTLSGTKAIAVQFGANSLVVAGNGSALFVAAGVDPDNGGSGYSVSGGQVSVAGGTHSVTVTLADEFGNAVTGQGFLLNATSGGPLGSGVITAFAESSTAGTYIATITSSNAGVKPISATWDGNDLTLRGNGTAEFIAGGVDTGNPGTRYSVSSGSEPVGTGLHTVTVTLADADGNPVSGQAAGLNATTTGDLGAGEISSFVESGTPGTYLAQVTSTVSGSKTITATFGASAITTVSNNVASFAAGSVDPTNPATGFSVSSGNASVAGGSHTVTVTLADEFGNPVEGLGAGLEASSVVSLGTGFVSGFVSTATPGRYTATVTSSVAGAKQITTELDGSPLLAVGNDLAVFVAGAVDPNNDGTRYTVSTGPQTVGTGEHTVTVTLADEQDNPISGQADIISGVTLDPLGTGSVGTFTETETPGTYTALITSTVSGEKTITVTADGDPLTLEGNGIAVFAAGSPDLTHDDTTYSVSTGAQTVVSGEHTVTIVLSDEFGNPVTDFADEIVPATSSDLGSGEIAEVTETSTPGTYTATVTSSVAGTKAITVEVGSEAVNLDGNGDAVFVAGDVDPGNEATGFLVSTGEQPVSTGTHTVTVTLADSEGNPVSGQAGAILASTNDGLGAGSVSDFTETTTPGTYTATITSTLSGGKTITVSVDGTGLTASGNSVALFAAGAVDPANPDTTYSVTGGTQTVGSGEHTVTIVLADAFGNPVPGQEAALQATTAEGLGDGQVGAFSETGTPGTYTAPVTSTIAGAKTVTATFNSTEITPGGNTTATFVAAGVDLDNDGSVFAVSTGDVSVDGGAHSIVVTLADEFGNPVSGQAAALAASTEDSLGSGGITPFTESGIIAGTYTATITSSVSGGKTIAVVLGSDPVTAEGNTVATFVAGGVDPENAGTRYSVSTGDEVVSTGQHTVTVTLADGEGNPVSGQAGGLEAATVENLGTGSITPFTETSTAGTYTATVTSNVSGLKPITVTFGASELTADGNVSASFVAGEVSPGNPGTAYSVSAGPQTVGTGSHTITVTLADAFGNPVGGRSSLLLPATSAGLGSGTLSGFVETGTPGTYTATVTSTLSGSKPITVAFDGLPVAPAGNGVALFVAAAVDLESAGSNFVVSSGDASIEGGSHSVTVTLQDEFGNPVGGLAADLNATTGQDLGSGEISEFVETGTAGTYSANVTSSIAGTKTIAVTYASQPVTAAGNTNAVFVAGGVDTANDGTRYSVTSGDEPVGSGEHTVTVTLADSEGNPVPGQAAGLLASTVSNLGGGGISEFTETGTAGTYTATVTSTIAGAKSITVAFGANQILLDGNGDANFTAGGADLANPATRFSVSSGDVSVEGGSHTVTVTLADEFGNAVSGEEAELLAETVDGIGGGDISVFAETAIPGTYTASVTSTAAGNKTMTATFGGNPILAGGNTVARFIAGGTDIDGPGTAYSVTGGTQIVNTGTHTVTVTLADAEGNPVPGQAAGLTASTGDNLGLGEIADFIETATAGTYTAAVTSTVSGPKTITVLYGADAVALGGNNVAFFVPGSVDFSNADTNYTVSTGTQTVGSGEHTVTVVLSDEFGNAVSGQEAAIIPATTDDLGSGEFSAFTETATAGTYEAIVSSTVSGAKDITVTVGVNSVNLSGNGTAMFVAGPVDLENSATSFVVSTGEVSVDGGSHSVTVTLADEFNNPVTGLSASLLADTVDNLGSGTITGFVETATAGTYEAIVTSSLAGSKELTVEFDGDPLTASGNTAAVFVAGGVDVGNSGTRYSVSTGSQTVSTGEHTVTVTLSDADGNPVPGQAAGLAATTVADLGTGEITLFSETSTAGTYQATVTSTVSGTKPITVVYGAAAVTAGGNTNAVFEAGEVDLNNANTQYSVTTGDQPVGTGQHTVTAMLRDEFNNPVTGQAAELVADSLGDLGTGTISTFTETSDGVYEATLSSTVSGSKNVVVDLGSNGVNLSGNGVASFVAGAVDLTDPDTNYTVTTGDQQVGTGQHTITVTLVDEFGNGVPAQQSLLNATTSALIGTGQISIFTATATPGIYVATVTSSVSGSKAIEVALDDAEVNASGNSDALFVSGGVDPVNPASYYAVSTGNETVGTGSHTVSVALADSFGNPVPGQASQLVAATSGDLGTGVFTGFIETATAGIYEATVTSTVAGLKPVTVTYDLVPITLAGNGNASFVAAEVDLANAGTQYSVSQGNASVEGGTHLVTITLADSFANPVPGQAANLLAATAAELGTGEITSVVESATTPGTYEATVTSSVAGAKPITVTFDGEDVALNGNGTAAFIAGGPDPANVGTFYEVTEGGQTVGSGSHTVSVRLSDSAGNPVSGEAAALTANTVDSLGTGGISDFTETGTPGFYEAIVTSTLSGGKTITVSLGASALRAEGNAVALFVAAAVDPNNPGTIYSVTTGNQQVGTGQHTITVTLADEFGNRVSGQSALLAAATTSDLGSGNIGAFVETGATGAYLAQVTSTLAGSKAITAGYDGLPISLSGNGDAVFVAAGVDIGNAATAYSVSSGDVSVSGGMHTVTITLADTFGNPVSGMAANLLASTVDNLGTGSVTGVTEQATPGTYQATVTSSIAGNKNITVLFDAAPVTLSGNGTARFVAGGVDIGNSGTAYSVSTGTQTVGSGQHTITVTLADASGNPVGSQAAGLLAGTESDLGGGTITGFTESGTIGTYLATVSSTKAGDKEITVTFGGNDVVLSGNGNATFVATTVDPGASSTFYTVSTGEQTAGTGSHTILVSLTDTFGNAVSGAAAALSASSNESLGSGTISGFTETAVPGTYSATVTSTVSGTKTFTVTHGASQLAVGENGAAVFTAADVDLGSAATRYSVTEGEMSVVGGAHRIIVRLADQFGNPVLGQAGSLAAATLDDIGDGSVSGFTEISTTGVYEATITSTVVGDKTVIVTFEDDPVTLDGNNIARFVAGGVDPSHENTLFSVTVGDQRVGSGEHTVTVQLADAEGNPVAGQAAGLSASSSSSLGSGSISDFGETSTPGTYTATLTSSASGKKTVSVSFGGSEIRPSGNAVASFVAADIDLGNAQTTFTVSQGNRTVGSGHHTITVTLADSFGNPVGGADSGALAASTSAAIGAGVIGAFSESSSAGTYTAQISSTLSGGKPVTVTFNDESVTSRGNSVARFVAGVPDPSRTEISATSPVIANGSDASIVTVKLFDEFGNPAEPGAAPKITSTLGTVETPRYSGGGVYTVLVTSTEAGTAVVSVEVQGTLVDETAEIEFTPQAVNRIWMELESERLRQGDTQFAYGHLFAPGERVSGLLESEPISLGAAIADSRGNVEFEVWIPSNFDIGWHTVTLTGETSGSVQASFYVEAKAQGLINTGGDLWVPLGIAVVLLSASVLSWWLSRRRRRGVEPDSA